MENTENLKAELIAEINRAADMKSLEEARVAILGKKGKITEMMKTLGALPQEEKIAMGKTLNILKGEIEKALAAQKAVLEAKELNDRLASETVDVTLPVRPENQGRLHPISQIYEEVVAIFGQMGFSVAEGPDIEDQFHNFNALNMPANHPARQMQDTFYIPNPESDDFDDSYVVRTHTSPVQIRTMEKKELPIRVVAPGRTYRSDYDATHTPMFHQIEGLVIDTNITMAHLKGCLYDFIKAFFELDEIPVRYRPSFFPFTEPSAEMDIGCLKTKNELKIGAGTDFQLVFSLKAANIHFGRRFGKRKKRRAIAYRNFIKFKKSLNKIIQAAFQMRHGNIGVNNQPLDLVKHRGMCRIIIRTICPPRRNNADRQLFLFHCPNLNR